MGPIQTCTVGGSLLYIFRKPTIISCQLCSAEKIISAESLKKILRGPDVNIIFYLSHALIKWYDYLYVFNGFSGTFTPIKRGMNFDEIVGKLSQIKLPINFIFPKHNRTNICLTSDCNLSCPYCFISFDKNSEQKEIPFNYIKEFLRTTHKQYSLYGGEPLLYLKKHREIYNYLGSRASIVTNGTIVSELPFLINRKVSLSISLYTATKKFLFELPNKLPWTGLITLSKDTFENLHAMKRLIKECPPKFVSLNADYGFLREIFNGLSQKKNIFLQELSSFLKEISEYAKIVIKPFGSLFSPSFCPYTQGLTRSLTIDTQTCYCQAILSSYCSSFDAFRTPPSGFNKNNLFTGCPYWEQGFDYDFWQDLKINELVLILSLVSKNKNILNKLINWNNYRV